MANTEDPYHAPAGPDLDHRIHREIFDEPEGSTPPPYSTDEKAAKSVLKKLKSFRSQPFATGETRIRGEIWYFARYGSDPSTSTEVLSESFALSICRLALVIESQG